MENATAYGMFRRKLVEIGSNEDRLLVGHTSTYPLWPYGWFHVPCGSTGVDAFLNPAHRVYFILGAILEPMPFIHIKLTPLMK